MMPIYHPEKNATKGSSVTVYSIMREQQSIAEGKSSVFQGNTFVVISGGRVNILINQY